MEQKVASRACGAPHAKNPPLPLQLFQACWGENPNPPTRKILLRLRPVPVLSFEKILSIRYCSKEGEKRKFEIEIFRKNKKTEP